MSESGEAREAAALALLDEVVIGSARGGRKPAKPLTVEVVRSLTPEDLPALLAPPPVGSPALGGRVLAIRHSHHLLARLLAEGLHDDGTVSLISGYSPAYISSLKGDPSFAELLAYYQTQREMVFVEAAERMKVLGLSTLDELQSRLESEADKWTKRELMELAELLLVKGKLASSSGQAGAPNGPGVTVNVKFVTAAQPSPLVDVTPNGASE